ncbi:MAG: phosphoribosylanthranilate isomerase [Verrucomicrobiota bacterium]|nr:phosphoribosylanthranilate isomerase [Verrucomicrobiota bacterium]
MFEFDNPIAIKVCGVTNSADALFCAERGVEMIGLNFASDSPRRIRPSVAGEIIASVRRTFPRQKFIGIFVNQELFSVRKLITELALDGVQLHGDESAQFARKLDDSFVIKALRVGNGDSSVRAGDYACDAILLDSWSANARGGTGETFPWEIAAALRPEVKRLILAGGLTSENVVAAIAAVRPFAVDTCSGVELAPGRKDHEKVARFVAAVRGAGEAK